MPLGDTIPGGSPRTAALLLAALGTDMPRCPSATPLASWAGMCPGNDERGGKRLNGKTRQGSRGRRQVLVAAKTQGTSRAAQYRRRTARRGQQRARIALGQTILTMASHVLTRRQPSRALGAAYCDTRAQRRMAHRLVRRLEGGGDRVSLQPNAL